MANWLATHGQIRPSILWIGATELLFCVPMRHEVSMCDGTVFLLPLFAGLVGAVSWSAAARIFRLTTRRVVEGP